MSLRYLHRPGPAERLSVRGRYECRDGAAHLWGVERWERYRTLGTPVQLWRSEWRVERGGQQYGLLSHGVLSEAGMERLKLRAFVGQQFHPTLTLTLERDHLTVSVPNTNQFEEVALPPGYGLVTPLPSLARFAFPFDLAHEGRELAMTYLLRLEPQTGALRHRPTKFGYTPRGLRAVELAGESVRAKGWQREVPGLPLCTTWFDRHGTPLLVEGSDGDTIRLTEWQPFG